MAVKSTSAFCTTLTKNEDNQDVAPLVRNQYLGKEEGKGEEESEGGGEARGGRRIGRRIVHLATSSIHSSLVPPLPEIATDYFEQEKQGHLADQRKPYKFRTYRGK